MADMTGMTDTAREDAERRRMEAIWWAGALIWLGLALGAEYLDILPAIGEEEEWWPWIFIGLGPWALLFNVYRLTSDGPKPNAWDWIWTAIFMGVATSSAADVGGELLGAIILVVAGVVFMSRAVSHRE
jgi:tellurite resistance protein TehA-like permease